MPKGHISKMNKRLYKRMISKKLQRYTDPHVKKYPDESVVNRTGFLKHYVNPSFEEKSIDYYILTTSMCPICLETMISFF